MRILPRLVAVLARLPPVALALAGGACANDLEVLPGEGTPPPRDPALARCSVVTTTSVFGTVLSEETWDYDREGRRKEIRFDDDGDGEVDRVHDVRWADDVPVRIEGTAPDDPDYAYLETREYGGDTLLSRRESFDRTGPAGREQRDTLYTYIYDQGLTHRVTEDDDADGTIDRRVRFVWADDLSRQREIHEDVTYRRRLDSRGRALSQREIPDDPDLDRVLATFAYEEEEPAWPTWLFVDVGIDDAVDVTVHWSYDCP